MNKNGFTLVEVISVIALLGLIIGIAVPSVVISGNKAKERTLNSKIENIEKAAVMYGQDNRANFTNSNCDLCKGITNCYCYDGTITVGNLANPDGNDDTEDGYIEYDDKDGKLILNSTDETKSLNNCEIQIYQKYGKIYAVYDKSGENCWID